MQGVYIMYVCGCVYIYIHTQTHTFKSVSYCAVEFWELEFRMGNDSQHNTVPVCLSQLLRKTLPSHFFLCKRSHPAESLLAGRLLLGATDG